MRTSLKAALHHHWNGRGGLDASRLRTPQTKSVVAKIPQNLKSDPRTVISKKGGDGEKTEGKGERQSRRA